MSERHAPAIAFANWLDRKKIEDPGTSLDTLVGTYGNLCTLRDQQRNHIWGYVARNLSRPVWLAASSEKVDILIGNPPWLAQHDMSRAMQQRLRKECKARGIWAGGKVATHQDLSSYFFARCTELYLRKDGRIAFVMPYATMSRQQYQGFRSGVFAGSIGKKQVRVYRSVRFTGAWTFDDSVQPLFKVPSCVLFAREGEAGPLPSSVTAYSGQLPQQDASADQAATALASRTLPWPELRKEAKSAYGARFKQGATVVPRLLFVVERATAGRFGANPKAPLVESRRTNLEKKPWKVLETLRGPVELEFLRPLYLGESLTPFRLLEPVEAIIPWDETSQRLIDSNNAQLIGHKSLGAWLKRAEEIWAPNRHDPEMSLTQQIDYFGKLSAQFPLSTLRVIYSASGTIPAAALLRNANAVVEHKLYWAAIATLREGRYMLAILNSEVTRAKVAPHQSRGQWGARDFDKLLAEAIPQFDPNNPLHLDLASAAATAEKVAGRVALPANIHFIRARKLIRDALRTDGIAGHMDALVSRLLNGH